MRYQHPIIFHGFCLSKADSHALNTGNPTCDQQCSTTDGSRKDFAHHGAILNIQAFNLPRLFYLHVHEINVLYIWYSIHVHWILYMYTGIRTCCFSHSFQSQKDPLAAQYPKQCVLCLPVTARTICTAGLGAYSDDTLIYWLQDC